MDYTIILSPQNVDVTIPDDLSVTGVIMTDRLRSLDYRSRQAISIGTCPEDLLMEVLTRIYPILF
jgi:mRNA interferase MazF